MFVSPEIWDLRRIVSALGREEITPDLDEEHAPAQVDTLSLCQTLHARYPQGLLILAYHHPDRYTIVDGTFRLNALARVFHPQLFPGQSRWTVGLLPFDDPDGPGRLCFFGDAEPPPAVFPLDAMITTVRFLNWERQLKDTEGDTARYRTILEGAHEATRMLETPMLVSVMRPSGIGDHFDLATIRRIANTPFRLRQGRQPHTDHIR